MGTRDSGTRQAALRLFRHFGVTEENLKVVDSDWTQVSQIQDADAVVAVIKVGHKGIADLLEEGRFRLLSIDHAGSLALKEPMFRLFEIPEDSYRNSNHGPIQTLATTALLVVRRDAPSRLVEECLQAIYESNPPLEETISLELASNWQGLPYHEAARRYFARIEGAR